jgi:hypothetical protein
VAGEGLERLGGLGCALDAGLVVDVQGLGCGHDDGEHDEVGERHAGAALGFVAHLFEAVGALPEEQVRRDVVPSTATRSTR